MIDLEIWHGRANGGDSRFAIALGLMAIADAIKAHSKDEAQVITTLIESEISTSLDEKFEMLREAMQAMGPTMTEGDKFERLIKILEEKKP